jgi:hypothetical protein
VDNPVWPIQLGRSTAVPGASAGGAGEWSASPGPWAPPPPPFPATPPARRSRRRWWLFGCGGCGAIALIIVVVVAVFFATSFSSSPLRHFPTEAGASSVSDNFEVSGEGSAETLVIDDPRSLTDVETFYESALSTNGWTVQASDPAQAQSGDSWPFSRAGLSAQFAVTFVAAGASTEITVQYQTGGSAPSPLPTAQGADSSVTALMLNPTDASRAVGGAAPLSGVIDAQMSGQAGTDMRTYLTNDGTVSLIIALVVDSSRAAAATDYPAFLSASCPPGGQSTSTHPAIGTAEKADEFKCVSGAGTQLGFLQGGILCGVSAASASIAEAVARAESAKIAQVTGT